MGRFFARTLKNTLYLSILGLVANMPAQIILALLFNELRQGAFKSTIQTISYLPLSVPSVITIMMYYMLARWNGYFWPMVMLIGAAGCGNNSAKTDSSADSALEGELVSKTPLELSVFYHTRDSFVFDNDWPVFKRRRSLQTYRSKALCQKPPQAARRHSIL